MANQTQKPPKRRSIWSLLSSLLLIAAAVGIMIWMVNSMTRGTTITFATYKSFEKALETTEILRIDVSDVNSDAVVVTGKLREDKKVKSFKWNTNESTWFAEKYGELYFQKLPFYSYITETVEYKSAPVEIVEVENPETGEVTQVEVSTYKTSLDVLVQYNGLHYQKVTSENDIKSDDFQFVYTTDNPHEVGWFETWGPYLIFGGLSLIVMFFIFWRLSSSVNNSNRQAMDYNRSRARKVDSSKVKFADVAGCDEEKAEMIEIVQYLKEPSKFIKSGAKLPKGILLVGPPGTGKTLLAKATAGEAGVPFFSISGSDFVEMFVGVGAGRVRDMFKVAKQNAPCLIFIDEIDAVGRQRGAGLGGGNDEREQTLNQLLVEMDGFSDNSGIIVIAATNREDVLDPALLRAGRFDRQITVNLPDRKGREEIFKVHSRNKRLAPDVDFAQIAKRTTGFSGADIENIMNEAAILAVRRNKTLITTEEIDEAIDRRIAGPAKSSRALSKTERKAIAYHEAGHALIGIKLKHSDKVQKITIIPRGRTGGHVMMTPEEDRFLLTKKQLEARIVGYLGGRTSEEIFFDDISTGAQNDIEVATRIARMMVTEFGMSSLGPIQYEKDTGSVFLGRDYNSSQKNFSIQVAFEIDNAVRKIITEAHDLAREILTTYKDDVILIAETLLEKETITAEQIDYLLEHRKLPEPVIQVVEPPLETPEIISPEVIEEAKEEKAEEEVIDAEEVSENTPEDTPNEDK